MGALGYFSDLFGRRKIIKKRKQIKTVELKVRMDCDGCERKVRKALASMSGVQSVEIDRKLQKVTVTGYVEANKVLKKVKESGKRAELWPYVPYNLVSEPYSPHTYDKKAPPGYVRKESFSTTTSNSNPLDEQLTTVFSDENPNACLIM